MSAVRGHIEQTDLWADKVITIEMTWIQNSDNNFNREVEAA